jgi:sugar transferase (PEP-CTERM/EpsH1 system associated)
MKILFLTSRFPFPPIGGDKLRFFNILKYLGKKHNVSIVCFSECKVSPDILEEYKAYFCEIDIVILPKNYSYINCLYGLIKRHPLQISYYYSKEMERLVEKKIDEKKFDLLFVHLIRMAEYVKEIPIYKILDMTDAQSLNYLRGLSYRRGVWSIINKIEMDRAQRYEQAIWRYFDKTLVVSPVDLQYLKKLDNEMSIDLLPNGVDIERYKFRLTNHSNKKICFVGNMRTFPNTDAVIYFCKEILPLIKKKMPEIEFYIVGIEPSKKVKQLSNIKNVFVTGKVENISEYIHTSAVSVAPMRVGAGVQNKILESMALGTPVVTTSIGLEGIEATLGKEILVADSPIEFADKVVELIENKKLRERISINARKFIEENYIWDKVLKKLDEIIK